MDHNSDTKTVVNIKMHFKFMVPCIIKLYIYIYTRVQLDVTYCCYFI
jgi:hypothetical protein